MKQLLAALVLLPAVAHAHALLKSATPAVGGTVAAAPPAVELRFSEGVEPRFSTIEVAGEAGDRVDAGPAARVGTDAARLTVPLRPLSPGRYTVTWHAVSVDTHRTEGKFTFTVAPPAP